MTTRTCRHRGRPAFAWLTVEQVRQLPQGTAIVLDRGTHKASARGRLIQVTARIVKLSTTEVEVGEVKRARVVTDVFEPGDAVVKRGVSASVWRGGVVAVRDGSVQVEQIDGSWVWMPEAALSAAVASS